MKHIDRNKHKALLSHELAYQKNQFEIDFLQKQFSMLVQRNEAFVAQYLGVDDKRGNLILKFSSKRGVPLKNRHYIGLVPSNEILKSSSWTKLSYGSLRNQPSRLTELIPVWYKKEKDNLIVGFKGAEVIFSHELPKNCPVIVGPNEPPLEYLNNLVQLVGNINTKDKGCKFLDIKIGEQNWNPKDLNKSENQVKELMLAFEFKNEIIVQGPPGTGKTFLMADFCKHLLENNATILITALTNRALIELASKEHLVTDINEKRVYKTNLSTDELKKLPKLQEGKNYDIHQKSILLTTYYGMSDISNKSFDGELFDYVIIEEASQAFLSTIAAARRLGKKCLIVGDIAQLEPIFSQQINKENKDNLKEAIDGLKTLCYNSVDIPAYILTKSYRLSERAVNLTNSFYAGMLTSNSDKNYKVEINKPVNIPFDFPINGGSVWLKMDLELDNKLPDNASEFINNLVVELHEKNPTKEIAVLSFFRATTNRLQSSIYSKVNNSDNILVETISRIQGLTTDICIFFIPNSGAHFSLHPNLFNVATSRSKLCTIIISSKDITSFTHIDNNVKSYFQKLNQDFSYLIEADINIDDTRVNSISKGDINAVKNPKYNVDTTTNKEVSTASKVPSEVSVKIVGKIDISKFEKKKKEIKKDKINLYVIDTNVFVDYPAIISKINKEYPVILSAKVLDELDNLKSKLDNEGKINVQKALKSINHIIDKRDLRMELADLSLLPLDFNKRSPDNMILTVALKFNSENPILLTSDNGLQIKAKGLGITTITLKEFLKQVR